MKIKINIKLTILSAIMCLMVSCAQDGPYEAGKLECDFSTFQITPTTAVVSATLPSDNENLLISGEYNNWNIRLTEKKPTGHNIIKWDDLIAPNPYPLYSTTNHIVNDFEGLKPNTIYYPVIFTRLLINNEYDEYYMYSSGYSFTTAQSGDYSSLFKDIKCELLHYAFGYAQVEIILPLGLILEESKDRKLKVSTSRDMENAESYYIIKANTSDGERKYVATITIPETGRYYFEVVGPLSYGLSYETIYDWNGEEVTVKIPNYLDIYESESHVSCSLVDYNKSLRNPENNKYEDFTVVKVKMPSNVKFLNYGVYSYGNPAQCFATSVADPEKKIYAEYYINNRFPYNCLSEFERGPHEYIFMFKPMDKGQYRLQLEGCSVTVGPDDSSAGVFRLEKIPIVIENTLDLTSITVD